MAGRVFGDGGQSSEAPAYHGRIGLDNIGSQASAYATYVKKKKRIDEVNAIGSNKTSLKYEDQLQTIKAAHADGDISDEDYTKLVKVASTNQTVKSQAQVAKDHQINPVEGFLAGIGGLVHDTAVHVRDTGVSLAKDVQIQQQADTFHGTPTSDAARKSKIGQLQDGLKRGVINQKQYDDNLKAFDDKVATTKSKIATAEKAVGQKLDNQSEQVWKVADLASYVVPGLGEAKVAEGGVKVGESAIAAGLKQWAKMTAKAGAEGAAFQSATGQLELPNEASLQQRLEAERQAIVGGGGVNAVIGGILGVHGARAKAGEVRAKNEATAKANAADPIKAPTPETTAPVKVNGKTEDEYVKEMMNSQVATQKAAPADVANKLAGPDHFSNKSELDEVNRALDPKATAAGGEKLGDYYRRAKGEDWKVEKMSPDEYLDRTAKNAGIDPETWRSRPSGDVKKYAADMQKGDKFPMPYINDVRKTQEGRTRALAAKEAGQTSMRVAVASSTRDEAHALAGHNAANFDADSYQQRGTTKMTNGNSVARVKEKTIQTSGGDRKVMEIEAINSVDPRTGSASSLIDDIKEAARSQKQPVFITPVATPKHLFKGMEGTPKDPMKQADLVKWYEKQGFKHLPLEDGSHSGDMVYLPPKKSAPTEKLGKAETKDVSPDDIKAIVAQHKARFGDSNVKLAEPNSRSLGSYKHADDMITLARGQADMLDTVNHESIHKAMSQYLSDREIGNLYKDIVKLRGGKIALRNEYRKNGYKDISWQGAAEEEIANSFVDFLKYHGVRDESRPVSKAALKLPPSIHKVFMKLAAKIDEFVANIKKTGRKLAAGNLESFYSRVNDGAFNGAERRETPHSYWRDNPSISSRVKDVANRAKIEAEFANPFWKPADKLKTEDDFREEFRKAAAEEAARPKAANEAGPKYEGQDAEVATVNANRKVGLIEKANNGTGLALRKLQHATSDTLQKTAPGRTFMKAIQNGHNQLFTDTSAIQRAIQRAADNGTISQANVEKFRLLEGNVKRTSEVATREMNDVQGMKDMQTAYKAITGSGKDKALKAYASAKSEVDLYKAGEKDAKANADYLAKQKETVAKYEGGPQGDLFKNYYKGLVDAHKDLTEKRYRDGQMTDEQYKSYKDAKYDYVRQQREVAQWLQDKGVGGKSGNSISISKSELNKGRNKYATNTLLDPLETYMAAYHIHVQDRAQTVAARFAGNVLEKAGLVTKIRTADMVKEKHKLMGESHDVTLQVNKTKALFQSQKNAARQLTQEVSALMREGKSRIAKDLNEAIETMRKAGDADPERPMNTSEVQKILQNLSEHDYADLRRKIEHRTDKLNPLLDSMQITNKKLNDLYAKKHGLTSDINGIHINPKTSNIGHFEALDKGIKTIYKTTPEIADAVHHFNPPQLGTLMQIVRVTNDVFKAGTTGVDPGFTPRNLVRDWAQGAITSQNIFRTHLNPFNYAAVGLAHVNVFLNKEHRAAYEQIEANLFGGRRVDQYKQANLLHQNAKRMMIENSSLLRKAGFVLVHPSQYVRKMEDILGFTEGDMRMLNAYGTYKDEIARGATHDEALGKGVLAGRENTTDFNSAGKFGRVLNQFLPYSNAKLQDGRIIARSFRDRPVSTLAKVTVLLTAPTLASTYWNTSTQENKDYYNQIPDYVKEANFVVVLPGAKNAMLIPKPQGYAQLTEPARKFVEYLADNDADTHKGLGDFLTSEGAGLAGNFGNTFSPVDFSSTSAFIGSILPPLVKGPVENVANHNFYYDSPIVPDSKTDLPAQDQHNMNTSQLSTYVSSVLNVSPLKVDNWIKETFGSVGQEAQAAADRYLLGGKDHTPDPDTGKDKSTIGGKDTADAIVRGFTNPPTTQATTDFYDTYNPVNAKKTRVSQQVTALLGQGKNNQARRIAEEYNASIEGQFKTFDTKYKDSAWYDSDWKDKIGGLRIVTTDRAFKQRYADWKKKNQ